MGSPRCHPQNQLTESRSNHRDENEHSHNEGHDPSHGAAFILIADQGDADYPRACQAEPLEKTPDQHER